MKISFIGFGNMARAIAQALAKNPQYCLFASAPSLTIGVDQNGVRTHHNNLAISVDADMIILAVKPAAIANVLTALRPTIATRCVVVSVAAGVSLNYLESYCPKGQAIVRSMPNLPIAVREGATALIANQITTQQQKQAVENLFQCGGFVQWLSREADIDILTALSGSGPAYVYFFLEAMMNAAQKLGLEKEIAQDFCLQTVKGALSLLEQSNLEPQVLRKKVTSPGGTTAAAIDILRQNEFDALLLAAIRGAFERAQVLASSLSK